MIPRFTRALLASILILAGVAHAADGTIYQCWDGRYWSGADSTACPPQVTITGGAGISDTAANITATTDSDSGTLYVCYKAAPGGVCPTAPTYAQMLAGGGGFTCTSNSSPAVGNNEFPISGLTASTSYCAWVLQVDDDGRPPPNLAAIASYVYESDAWATLAAAPETGPGADLATLDALFVDSVAGNNSNSCVSPTAPCATIAGAIAKGTPAGRDLYIKAGSDLQGTATINWSGSSSDRVVVGCYYLDTGNSNQATSCHEGTLGAANAWRDGDNPALAGSLTKPILRGTYTDACRTAGTCLFNTSGAIPASQFSALLDVTSSYVTIQDIQVLDSAALGIQHTDGSYVDLSLNVDRVYVRNTVAQGVSWLRTAGGSVMTNSWIENCMLGRSEQGIDGACVRVRQRAGAAQRMKALIENNRVHNSGGEGINIVQTADVIVRGNIVSNTSSPGLMSDNSKNILFEHNIVTGKGFQRINGTYQENFGAGMYVVNETYCSGSTVGNMQNSLVTLRNNVIVNTHTGLRITTQNNSPCTDGKTAFTSGFDISAYVYGNTILARAIILQATNITADTAGTIEIKGNAFIGPNGCTWPTAVDGVTISHNLYGTNQTDNDCEGTSSQIAAAGFPIESDYSAFYGTNDIPTVSDVTPGGGSAALNNGTALTSAHLDAANFTEFANISGDICTITEANWEKGLYADFACATRGATPDIGAVEVP